MSRKCLNGAGDLLSLRVTAEGAELGRRMTPFPLTPALSLGEREKRISCWDEARRIVLSRWLRRSLSRGERHGVRGILTF
jgi:hypothetical protein